MTKYLHPSILNVDNARIEKSLAWINKILCYSIKCPFSDSDVTEIEHNSLIISQYIKFRVDTTKNTKDTMIMLFNINDVG